MKLDSLESQGLIYLRYIGDLHWTCNKHYIDPERLSLVLFTPKLKAPIAHEL
jgi:hypothetical protein